MKKIIMSSLAIAMLSTNAFAGWFTGTVQKIERNSSGETVIRLNTGSTTPVARLLLTGDEKKQFMAVVLTAKASGEQIELYESGGQWLYYSY